MEPTATKSVRYFGVLPGDLKGLLLQYVTDLDLIQLSRPDSPIYHTATCSSEKFWRAKTLRDMRFPEDRRQQAEDEGAEEPEDFDAAIEQYWNGVRDKFEQLTWAEMYVLAAYAEQWDIDLDDPDARSRTHHRAHYRDRLFEFVNEFDESMYVPELIEVLAKQQDFFTSFDGNLNIEHVKHLYQKFPHIRSVLAAIVIVHRPRGFESFDPVEVDYRSLALAVAEFLVLDDCGGGEDTRYNASRLFYRTINRK